MHHNAVHKIPHERGDGAFTKASTLFFPGYDEAMGFDEGKK